MLGLIRRGAQAMIVLVAAGPRAPDSESPQPNPARDGTRTLATRGAATSASRPALRVTVLATPSAPAPAPPAVFARDRVVLGRGEGVDVALADPTVSAFHCELAADPEGVRVTDLGSRNGTRANGVRVERGVVPSGAVLSVGASTARVELDAAAFAPERSDQDSFGPLVGASPAMRELYVMLARLAQGELSVLIAGETGTGKELAARALHAQGRRGGSAARPAGPFVVIDCTAIPPALAESVLFGHEKGAFTGASQPRVGLFEAADGGTVFLDEVGELGPELQPKLLRVLERREVTPVGSTRPPRRIDVRIVSATWRDLRAMVNRGTFREDLYYRLAQATVRMPSLAERPEDVRPLAQHLLGALAWDVPAARAFTPEALDLLAARAYPGNVRELKSTVERAAMLAAGPTITPADLAFERQLAARRTAGAPAPSAPWRLAPPAPGAKRATPGASPEAPLEPFRKARRTTLDEFEREYLARLLEREDHNLSRAARLAGLDRQTLRELLMRHGLRGED